MRSGIIVKGIGGFYYVRSQGRVFSCRARGKFRKDSITPFVGDRVEFSADSSEDGYLFSILERKNTLIRPPMANLDQLFIVTSTKDPFPDFLFIDKLTAVCEHKNIEPVIVINKSDLKEPDEIKIIYEKAGIPVIVASAVTGRGIAEIKNILTNKLSALCGQSGVGKSSLFNHICPESAMEVGSISSKVSRGRHTTRHIELICLDDITYIADTPGFSAFDITHANLIKKEELPYTFREFNPFLQQCEFNNCSHTCEKGCAVLEANRNGLISDSRLNSYKELYNTVKNIKDWEF